MSKRGAILFRAHHDLNGVTIYTRSLPRTFSVTAPHGHDVDVRLVPANDDTQPGRNLTDVSCHATLSYVPGRRPSAGFSALAAGRLPEDHTLDLTTYGGGRPYFLDDADSVVGAAPYEVLPAHMRSVIDEVIGELDEAIRRVTDVVRWRLGDRGPYQPIERRRYTWSLDGDAWIPLLPPWDSGGRVSSVPALSPAIRDEIQGLLDAQEAPPLGHELWREAWELRVEHPRSALLIGMSALEIGLKEHIASIEPATTWLLEEMQTPPSNRLMAEYVPSLHGQRTSSIFTKEQIALIKKGISHRNRVTHTGSVAVSADFLEPLLELVRHVLRTLDEYAGHHWAHQEVPAARTEDYPTLDG